MPPRPTTLFVCLILLVVLLPGCQRMFIDISGHNMVKSPNYHKDLKEITRKAKPPVLAGTVIDHTLRVHAPGPPAASISVWIIDPSNEQLLEPQDPSGPTFQPTNALPRTTLPPRGTILIVHGFHDLINQSPYLMWARILAAQGYRAVLVELRGHGQSTGDYNTFGVLESQDLSVAISAISEQGLLVEPLGVMAVSMGAATAIQLASHDSRIDAMALISTFTTMRQVVPDFGRAIGFQLSDALYQQVINRAGELAGFEPDTASSIAHIGHLDTPILLFHGEDDQLIPIHHAVRLYHAANRDDVELIRIAGADHSTLANKMIEPIRQPLLDWMRRYLFEEPLADQRRAARRATAKR